MAFFQLRNRGPQANEGRNTSAAAAPAESVEAMRRRARHRLVGAAVLVLAGVIGFPLLFDTQPRPVPVDIPIEIPDRNQAKPLPLPTPPTAAAPATAPPAAGPAPANRSGAPSSSGSMITEKADGTEVPATPPPANQATSRPEPEPAPEPKAEARAEPKPETKPKSEAKSEPSEPKPDTRSAEAKSPPAKPAADESGARARALLEGKSVAAAKAAAAAAAAKSQPAAAAEDSGRFVVQVGAFAEADKAREVRQKLDQAGLKAYTQVLKTPQGERTRVRVGPFASRAEADRAASRIKGLSLAASVLTL